MSRPDATTLCSAPSARAWASRSLRSHCASADHWGRATMGRVTSALADSPFLLACRRRPVPHTPVWFMRQAGRSLPEYRALREGVSMLDSCTRPELVTEITMQPVRRHGVDAAILFSDIVLPLKAIGIGLDIAPGV